MPAKAWPPPRLLYTLKERIRRPTLAVYIYADINKAVPEDPALISFGVKLTYLDTELTVADAEKNEAVCYMGDGTNNNAYMDPEIDNCRCSRYYRGQVGHCSPASPESPEHAVLLGKVFFDRVGSTMPFDPTLGLTYGRMTADATPALGAYKKLCRHRWDDIRWLHDGDGRDL